MLLLGCAPSLLADSSLVRPDDVWRYKPGTTTPAANWKTAADADLDSSWLQGPGGFGYADNTPELTECKTLLPGMEGKYTTVAMRRSFDFTEAPDPNLHLQLTMDYDDGFIAWLDGIYLVSANAPGAPNEPAYNVVATSSHESSRGNNSPNPPDIYDLGPVGTRLGAGTHTLAILGLNQSLTSSDFIQIATLSLVTNTPASTNCLKGLLTTDTVLASTNSPHLICGDLTVGAGVTLTIEPGAVVQLGTRVSLTVADGGALIAEGTPDARIQLMSATPDASWGGLVIEGSVGSPETRLGYVDFSGNGQVCIEVAGGTLVLDHATFGTTTHQYVSLDSSSFVISHCYFPSSTAAFELLHGNGGIKTGGVGIVRDSFFGTTSGYNDIMDFTGGNRPNRPIIQYYRNVFTGATDDILDLDGTDAWIEGNIFLHSHKNGAPDSSAAISGGNYGANTSWITIVGNVFFDCDQSATAKQGNFYTMVNNTFVHMTRTGGLDTADGVINVRDLDPGPPTTFGAGYYMEANIVLDAEQLVRNYDPQQTLVTWNNNILPSPWNGPGTNNLIADPILKHVPQVGETYFTNWTDAQVLWDWFSLAPGSPAIGTGPNGRDKGGVIPLGAAIAGEPDGTNTQTSAVLTVGFNRRGSGISPAHWPNGAGYTAYKWQLDGGAWSAETPITDQVVLTNLAAGVHQVAVVGKNDASMYQDDPLLGTNAVVTLSRPWTVAAQSGVSFTSIERSATAVTMHFTGVPGTTYSLEYKNAVDGAVWTKLADFPADPPSGAGVASDSTTSGAARFYRLSPAATP